MTKKKMKQRMAIDNRVVVVCSNHCSFAIDHGSFDCDDDCNGDKMLIVDDADDCREANETMETNCCSTSHLLSTFSSPHNQSDLCWWL